MSYNWEEDRGFFIDEESYNSKKCPTCKSQNTRDTKVGVVEHIECFNCGYEN